MPAPRINPMLMSAATRANLERAQLQLVGESSVGTTKQAVPKPRAKKKTLTPDMVFYYFL